MQKVSDSSQNFQDSMTPISSLALVGVGEGHEAIRKSCASVGRRCAARAPNLGTCISSSSPAEAQATPESVLAAAGEHVFGGRT